jgi:hypothetical protein
MESSTFTVLAFGGVSWNLAQSQTHHDNFSVGCCFHAAALFLICGIVWLWDLTLFYQKQSQQPAETSNEEENAVDEKSNYEETHIITESSIQDNKRVRRYITSMFSVFGLACLLTVVPYLDDIYRIHIGFAIWLFLSIPILFIIIIVLRAMALHQELCK